GPEGALEKFRESILRVCFFLFVCFSLSAPLAKPQTTRPSASSIETIAGGEPTSVPGVDFGFASVSGLAADADGSIYFSIQAKSRVYRDRKSTRLNSSHRTISYAVFCLKKKNIQCFSSLM